MKKRRKSKKNRRKGKL